MGEGLKRAFAAARATRKKGKSMTGDGAVVRLYAEQILRIAGDTAFDLPNLARAYLAQAAEIERLTREVQRRDLLLQSLTPMGSEYVNDPERCAAYAHDTRRAHFERWKKVALELKASEARNADLLANLINLLAAFDRVAWATKDCPAAMDARAAIAAAKGETV